MLTAMDITQTASQNNVLAMLAGRDLCPLGFAQNHLAPNDLPLHRVEATLQRAEERLSNAKEVINRRSAERRNKGRIT